MLEHTDRELNELCTKQLGQTWEDNVNIMVSFPFVFLSLLKAIKPLNRKGCFAYICFGLVNAVFFWPSYIFLLVKILFFLQTFN